MKKKMIKTKNEVNFTDIIFIIDRSGSMMGIESDMQGGINSFIRNQEESTDENRCNVSLYEFDTVYNVVYENVPVQDVREYTLVPRGGTALLDAVGKTINSRKSYYNSLPIKRKPNKVIFVIVTDGHENASNEFNREKVNQLVKEQKEKENWEFVFIGSGLEDFSDSHAMGMKMSNNKTFAKSSVGTQALWGACGQSVGTYRSMSAADYSAQVQNEEVGFFEVK